MAVWTPAAASRRVFSALALQRLALSADERVMLRWLLSLALLHGLIYLIVVPPWQHYDEPNHFLYAAEIAAGELHAAGQSSVTISRDVADSMYRFQFFPPGVRPVLAGLGSVPLGESQRVHSPLYYMLVAIPIGALRFLSVEQQLYAARAVSLLLYLITVVAAWRIAVAVLPDEPLMQMVLPALVTLAPAFTDLMTAVNSDVLANMSVTICLLGAVLLVRDGLRPVPLALALLGLSVALMTKRTAVGVSLPLALALIWSLRRRPIPWWVGALVLVGSGLLIGLAGLRVELLPGPSGLHPVLTPRAWLEELDRSYLRLNLDAWIESVTDVDRIGGRYQILVGVAFTGFWGRFGWGSLAVAPAWDVSLVALVLAATVGLTVGAFRFAPGLPLWQRRCLLIFGTAVIVSWLSIFVRLHPLPAVTQPIYVPRGRYMFWAIVPHIWLLSLGLLWLVPLRWRNIGTVTLFCFFVALDLSVWAWTMVNYYYLT